MALDTSSFRNACGQLAAGLAAARAAEADELRRDGVIQRFGDTDELSHEVLHRFREDTEPAPEQIRETSVPALIRLGSDRGLPLNGWDVWSGYREARGTTGHVDDATKAAGVFAQIPGLLADARHLLEAVERRLAAP